MDGAAKVSIGLMVLMIGLSRGCAPACERTKL